MGAPALLANVEAGTAAATVNLLVGLAVLALILVGQKQVRPVRANMGLPLILAIIGVIERTELLKQNQHIHHTGTIFAALAGSLALAVVTAAIRAVTVHIWIDSGQALRRGTWITALLWIASLAAHLGYDYLVEGKRPGCPGHRVADPVLRGHLHDQRLILQARAQRIRSAPGKGISDPGTHPLVTGSAERAPVPPMAAADAAPTRRDRNEPSPQPQPRRSAAAVSAAPVVTLTAGEQNGTHAGIVCARASASSASAASRALSPHRTIRSAIIPVTIGAEKEVPLHCARPRRSPRSGHRARTGKRPYRCRRR